jgi:hypothetical protein
MASDEFLFVIRTGIIVIHAPCSFASSSANSYCTNLELPTGLATTLLASNRRHFLLVARFVRLMTRLSRSNRGKARPIEVRDYIAPAAESAHLKPLQDASRERQTNGQMRLSIGIALMRPARSSPDFAAAAVKWAEEIKDNPVEDETEKRMREGNRYSRGYCRP